MRLGLENDGSVTINVGLHKINISVSTGMITPLCSNVITVAPEI